MPKVNSSDGPLKFFEGGAADVVERRAPSGGSLALLGANVVLSTETTEKPVNDFEAFKKSNIPAFLAEQALSTTVMPIPVEYHDLDPTPPYSSPRTPSGPIPHDLKLEKHDGLRSTVDKLYAASDAKTFAAFRRIVDAVDGTLDRQIAAELTRPHAGMIDQTPAMEEWYAYAEPPMSAFPRKTE